MSRLSAKTIEASKCEIKPTPSSFLTVVSKKEKAEAHHETGRSNSQNIINGVIFRKKMEQ